MQLKEALQQGTDLLAKGNVPSERLTAEVLLMHAANCDRAHLYAHPERELTDSEWVHYGRYLKERLTGKPTQYITGHQEFWGLDFLVNPSVLIPRSETELVVESALALARDRYSEKTELAIADVGTGSGCIAIALATELPQAKLFALEQSPEALETARSNAQRLGVEDRISFFLSDLLQLSSGDRLPSLELVVSNPPYVSERDIAEVMVEVRKFEPLSAIFAGEAGIEAYARLIPQAAQALRAGGYLVLELGYDVRERVRDLLSPAQWDQVAWRTDLAGIVRVVSARRVGS